jgi:hypothetical protein
MWCPGRLRLPPGERQPGPELLTLPLQRVKRRELPEPGSLLFSRGVRALTTAPDDDLVTLLERGLFTWLVTDGDMHLKNMALLKIAEAGSKRFCSVRMVPVG